MRMIFPVALALSALLGAACLTDDVRQAYPGAPLPANETCVLRVPAMLDVRAIDGVPTDWSLRIKKGNLQTITLLPGSHRLLVRYYDPTADESRREPYEVDRMDVTLVANPQSVHELKYETWTRNMDMQRAKQKVRVWVEQVSPGVPRATPAAVVGASATGQEKAAPAGGARMDALQNEWNMLAPPERASFRKWLLAQP